MIRNTRAGKASVLAFALGLAMSAMPALLGVTCVATWATSAHAQDAGKLLNDAIAAYEQSQFDTAIKLAGDALKSGTLNAADATRAREIIARAYVKAGRRTEGREAFEDILRTDPGYRPDAVRTPPDEMEVFNLALADYQKEQIEQGKKIPASISVHYGRGWSSNEDMSEVVQLGGGDEFDGDVEFGGAVRFPIRPKWSLDIELTRFRDTESDSFPSPGNAEFVVSALPLTVTAHYSVLSGPKRRVTVFLGAGPMLVTEARINLLFFVIPISISDSKTGFIIHGGAEGEWLVHKRLGVFGRGLLRSAKASGLDFGQINIYGGGPMGERDVDFSGFALHAGVRAYIGY